MYSSRKSGRGNYTAIASTVLTNRKPATVSISNKLLIDPYAKALDGSLRWSDSMFGYGIGDPEADLSFDERNNASLVPKSVVVEQAFTWGDDQAAAPPMERNSHLRNARARLHRETSADS